MAVKTKSARKKKIDNSNSGTFLLVNGKVNGLEIQVYCDDDTEQGAKDVLSNYYYSK